MIVSFHDVDVLFLTLVIAYGLLVVLFMSYRSVLALRSKRRATYAIQRALTNDPEFRAVVVNAKNRDFTPDELAQIRKLIRVHTRTMSLGDRKVVDAGLKQTSVRGVKRFVGEVVGHKLAA